MSRAIPIVITVILACICQTDLVKYIRIAGVAPDMMTVFLVLLTGYTGAYGGFCAGSVMAMLYDASVGYVLGNQSGQLYVYWLGLLRCCGRR